ncbi:MAG TPA: FkbM family methyltransferase [Candidatus Sulfotelmatobacter sp.]|nr:FkbM family methyltransferase [Candidatus Sulfotelmatobacter sp.]
MLRRMVRGARLAFHRGPAGRWIERQRQLRATRAWTSDDEAMRAFYAGFVRAGDLVFDVGANVGSRTKVFLRLEARVVAVEPQPACADLLARAFAREPRVTIVREALGREPGAAEMRLSDASTISSMSEGWIAAVRGSGRFTQYHWDRSVTVPVTTLDRLIQRVGRPRFIKIDVEGFEREVLEGLSASVPALSFEFTPEWLESTFACVAHLESLGMRQFNYSLGESMRLERADWLAGSELRACLLALRGDTRVFGDVYARAQTASGAGGRA